MTAEEWRPVVGYEGAYEVSDHGRVRSLGRTMTDRIGRPRRVPGGVLTPGRAAGYQRVQLCADDRRGNAYVHTLVLEAFVGPRPVGMEGLHGDGDPDNCTPGNLHWGTHQENTLDRVRHGRHRFANQARCKRRHLLEGRNLYARALPTRICVSCRRARGSVSRAAVRGVVLDLQSESDRHYALVMDGAVAP